MSLRSDTTCENEKQLQRASVVLGGSMIFVSIRCTLQYVILPFVLPLFGVGDMFSVTLSVVLGLVALGTILYNIYRLWNTSWRWRYLTLSTFIGFIIVVFLYEDFTTLFGIA